MSDSDFEEIVAVAAVGVATVGLATAAVKITADHKEKQKQIERQRHRDVSLRDNFHWFCQEGKLEDVKEALRRGVDINSIKLDQTGLMVALRHHNNSIVRLLLHQTGVNVTWQSSEDRASAFTAAVKGQLLRTIDRILLLEKRLHYLGDNRDGLKLLMEHPKSVRIGGGFWKHLIRVAVCEGKGDCVALLLSHIDHKYITELVEIAR